MAQADNRMPHGEGSGPEAPPHRDLGAEVFSLSRLVGDLLGDVSDLLRQELRLARAEAAEALTRIQTGLVILATGLLLGFCSLLLLLQALVAGLSQVWEPWLATTVVALATAVTALALVWLAQRKLRLKAAYPRRTVNEVREDTEMLMRKMQ